MYSLNVVSSSVDAHGLLQLGDGVGVPHVVFAVAAPLVYAAVFQHLAVRPGSAEIRGDAARRHSRAMTSRPIAVDAAGGVGEILVDHFVAQADRPRKSGRRDSSARCEMPILLATLMIALVGGLDVILLGRFERQIRREHAVLVQVGEGFEGQIGIDRAGAVADEQAEVVRLRGPRRFR